MAAKENKCLYCGCCFYGRIDAKYCSRSHKEYAKAKRDRANMKEGN